LYSLVLRKKKKLLSCSAAAVVASTYNEGAKGEDISDLNNSNGVFKCFQTCWRGENITYYAGGP